MVRSHRRESLLCVSINAYACAMYVHVYENNTTRVMYICTYICMYLSLDSSTSLTRMRRGLRACTCTCAHMHMHGACLSGQFHFFDADASGSLDRGEFLALLHQLFPENCDDNEEHVDTAAPHTQKSNPCMHAICLFMHLPICACIQCGVSTIYILQLRTSCPSISI